MRELTLAGWIIGYLLNQGPTTVEQILVARNDPDLTIDEVVDTLWQTYGAVYVSDNVWYVA